MKCAEHVAEGFAVSDCSVSHSLPGNLSSWLQFSAIPLCFSPATRLSSINTSFLSTFSFSPLPTVYPNLLNVSVQAPNLVPLPNDPLLYTFTISTSLLASFVPALDKWMLSKSPILTLFLWFLIPSTPFPFLPILWWFKIMSPNLLYSWQTYICIYIYSVQKKYTYTWNNYKDRVY